MRRVVPTGSEQRSLAQAFASVTHAAGSLEESYGQLHTEVVRLRGELEKTNRDLASSLLADATEDHAETRQWVDHLQAGLCTVSATVNNVLEFHSQPPLHSQPPPQFVPMNVVRLLRDTLDFLRPLARQRGMQIDFVNPPGEISIPADPQRLQQVLFNLAINAFRAMSPGGRLKVCAGPAKQGLDGRAQIDFEDEGTGISPENLEKIFQPGFTTNPGSPGLGLVVCKNIVEQHGGTIRVRSIPGQGTTFSLDFPVTGATA